MKRKSFLQRLMRSKVLLSTLLMLFVFSLSSLNVLGAYSTQSSKRSPNMSNVTIAQAFQKIEESTEYVFFYADNVKHELNKKTSIDATSKSIDKVLDEVLEPTNLTYSITNKQISILLKDEVQQQVVKKKSTYKGVVLDVLGDHLIGVAVLLKDTKTGAVTDIDGKFSIDAEAGNVLVVSYVGFKTKEIKLADKLMLDNIILEADNKVLDEVVVVGYGTMEKRQVTSSISSIGGDDLTAGMGGATITTALQGKISGLTISGLGSPNAAGDIQLRGLASINSSKGPLVVIDGIPGGDIRSLVQEDIASIDVLKDASAGAIYGTRAAGGVILITTKQAKEGPMKLTYTSEYALESWRKKPNVMSASEFLEAGLGRDYGGNTDWYDALSRTPLSHRQVINLAGGGKDARLYSTFTLSDQQGKLIGDGKQSWSGRVNGNFNLMDNLLEIRTHVEYREDVRDQRANGMHMYQGLKLNPTIPVYDENNPTGYNVMKGGWEEFNPVADIELSELKGKDRWTKADATFKVNILPELSWTTTIGYEMRDYKENRYTSAHHKESVDNGRRGMAKLYYDRTDEQAVESYGTYIKAFGKHNINATLGYSFSEKKRDMFHAINYDFPVDAVGSWDLGTGTWLSEGRGEMKSLKIPRERLQSYFGRANYSFDDKYMATATIRYEGSSKFEPDRRWGTFWSLSGGYRISAEEFMKSLTWISDLKLRLGYGVVGNNGFSPGKSRKIYQSGKWWPVGGEWKLSYGAKHNANPDLAWEEKKELNFGLDYAFLNNRIYGKLDLYRRKVDGMIYDISVPQPGNIYDKTTMNAGTLENTGWEFEIGGDIVKTKDFRYSSSLRLSHVSTKLKSLWGSSTHEDRMSMPGPGSAGTAIRLEPGRKIGQFYVWRYAGIDENGNWLLYDKDNNVIPADQKKQEDKAFVGNSMPKLIAGWDHTLAYKNWDMSISLRSWIDYDIYNTLEMYFGIPNVPGNNVMKDYYDRNKHIKGEKELSDYFIHDGTFLKIEAINIGYRLDVKKRFLDSARFYLTLKDVAYFTKYKGLNPEVDINGLDPGFEWFRRMGGDDDRGWKKSIYPQTIRWTLGIQLQF